MGVPQEIVSSDYTSSLTDENGYYEINIPFVEIDGVLDTEENLSTNFGQTYPEDYWGSNCDDNLEVTLDVNGSTIEGLDFGFFPVFDCPRLEVDLLIGLLRPGFSTTAAF